MGGEVNKKDDFQIDRTIFQVIFVGGCDNMKRVQKFCKYINLPCMCLFDLDKVAKRKNKAVCIVKTRFISNFLEKEKSFQMIAAIKNSLCSLHMQIN